MNLDDDIADFLRSAETKPAASKLESYAELIRELRTRRWTYVEIARALEKRFRISAAPSTIHHFVKVRAKRKTAKDSAGESKISETESLETPAARPRRRFRLDS
jgi:hypothetical protein